MLFFLGGGFTYLKERAGWGAKRLLSVVKKSLQNGIEKKMGWFFEILFLGDRDFLKIYYLRDRRGTGRLMVPGERERGLSEAPAATNESPHKAWAFFPL